MFFFLSKFLPLFIYPLGLAVTLILAGVLLYRQQRWQRATLILALLILWLGSNRWVAGGLVRSLEWQHLPSAELPAVQAIVVLGGGTRAHQPPRPTVELGEAGDRLLYAAALYHQGVAPVVLVTGGILPYSGAKTAGAESMLLVLESLDVPREAIWLEDRSINTYENGLYSLEILQDAGIQEVVLVTSAMHMPRSVAVFEKLGLSVIPAPTDYYMTIPDWRSLWRAPPVAYLLGLVPDAGNLYVTQLVLKEYLGILVYGLRGWI